MSQNGIVNDKSEQKHVIVHAPNFKSVVTNEGKNIHAHGWLISNFHTMSNDPGFHGIQKIAIIFLP